VLAGRIDRLIDLDDAPLDLGDGSFIFFLEAARQDDVGVARRIVKEEVDGHVELEFLERACDERVVRQRHFRIETNRQQSLDLAGVDLSEQLVGVNTWARQVLFVDLPDAGDVATMFGVADVAPAWQLIAFLAVFPSALSVRLPGDRCRSRSSAYRCGRSPGRD
jgi:hypothetical protein